ncbi:uncharacterized protein LOC118182083 [Stegodyphus dumicola]|uniref:uncharacterized protein LOC118182083 n=1 Tax=Stegodyphus dumicola TaxID=202533 RepID=UPI0015B2A342|nr:uncharacterized protein LOC118182083 [Stegodyphus dumicola]XP_035207259.1 uncharacterized protein LOC118182083 [Stegodyphus dumicola]XP_035207260.1 uncharacterized protein LOC118182083 [Stegodyphus dumicola]XP_035207261.1 uncharacterized protein LOC118182083 [Stegodyphus dumicola]XP_035207262.1 uncharacterized protein LOC118182083 [Stegodyphus dumicola]
MQQGCCDIYGMSVEKSMGMRISSDIMEPIELIHHVGSNERASPPLESQTCSGDEDGNSSENQNRSPPTSCENSTMEEPKTKKRRKQSNPLRYQTTPVMPLLENEDCNPIVDEQSNEVLDLQTKPEIKPDENQVCALRCHHCSSMFETEDLLRVHVEEEHVQKVLERQLQQQSYNKTTSVNNKEGSNEPAKENSSKASDIAMQQIVPLDQTRNSPADGLMQESREYKNPHFPFPPMPPFIPFTRSDESKPGNLQVPLSMFPNPMTPFLFPVIPQGQTPPVSNGNSHSGQGVRIFNLEAYCELCNKEFCNKYFLKTHKANKHGIYSVESIVSSPYGGPFLSPSLNSPIPLPHLLQTSTSEPLPSRTGLFNMESYCEICQKEFCNKYFLKKHRQKIHGIMEPGQNMSPSTTPSQDTKSNSPVMTTSALSLTSAPSFNDKSQDEIRDTSLSKMEFPSIFSLQNHKPSTPAAPSAAVVPNSSSSICPPVTSGAMSVSLQSPGLQGSSNENSVSHVFTPEKLREMGVINADAFCELCCKEFCNKYFLRTHKLNKHGINMPEISPGKSQLGPLPPSSHNQGSQSNEKGEINFEENRIPEELLQEPQAGLTFEGISGELSCDFCNRPFSSLYLLKMHKFYTHNIPYIKEESKSKPNSPIAENHNQENKENEFIKPHLPLPLPPTSMISDSIPTSLQEDAASQDLQKLQSMIRELNASAGSESSKIICNLCRLEFDNKYFLRAHMMNEHGVLPNEDGHVTGHSNSDFSLQSKLSECASDYQRLNYTNASPSVDSEAYCEICQKEFCSKYFLKTHKQNIHGLPVDMSSTPKKSLADEVCQIKTIVNNTLSTALVPVSTNGSVTPNTSAMTPSLSTASQPSVLSSLSAVTSHIPVITSTSPIITMQSQVSSPSTPLATSQPSLAVVPNSSGNTVLTSSAPHCHSLTPNTNSIQASNIGHLPSNLSVPKISSMSVVNQNLSISASSTSTPTSNLTNIAQMAAHTAHIPSLHHSSSNALVPIDKPRNLTGRNYCNICNKELCNKYFMKTHMLKMHGINLDSQPHEAARISTIGGVQCDICQKELCSKYFLKVHKQNTHGIFEEGSQGKDLRDHPTFLDKEQPLQGLDLSDPSGRYFSHYPEICPVCNCRFKSIKWLKAHMISDHGNILKENFSHNALPSTPDNSNTPIDSSCLCVLCGQGFPDKVALHVHLIKDHHSPSDELGVVQNNSGIKTSTADSSSGMMVPEQARVNGTSSPGSAAPPNGNHPRPHPKPHGGGGSRIYHCSFCVYSTRWLSNLYAHEKRHTGVNTEGEKKFVCRVCHRAYRYNHSLQRHFLSHRAAGLNVKDMAQPLIMTSHSPHHLSPSLNRPWNSHFHKKGNDLSLHNKGVGGNLGQSNSKIKRYRCSKCSKKFRSRELCLAHIHAAHSGGKRTGGSMLQKSVKPFRCRFCGFLTRAWNVLRIHINRQHHNDLLESVAKQPFDSASSEEKPASADIPSAAAEQTTPASPGTSSPKTGIPDGFPPGLPPPPPNSPHLPMTFAMPQNPPTAGSFIMQPFLLAQPECDGVTRNGTFVPSLVYLPVCQKVSQPMTVAFTLTPA